MQTSLSEKAVIILLISAILLSASLTLSMAVDNIAVGIGLLGLILSAKKIKINKLDIRILLITFFGLLTSLLSVNPIKSLKESRYLWHFIPYFVLSRIPQKSLPSVINVLGAFSLLGATGVIVGSFSHIQPGRYITQHGFINFISHLHFYSHPLPNEGFLSQHLTAAGVLTPISLLFLSLLTFYDKNKEKKLFYFIVFTVTLVASILTMARAYWLGLIVSVMTLPLIYRNKRSIIISLGTIVAIALILSTSPRLSKKFATIFKITQHILSGKTNPSFACKHVSSMDRVAMWKAGIDFYKNAPLKIKLLGVGTGFINRYDLKYRVKTIRQIYGPHVNIYQHLHSSLHNVYLQLLTEWGAIGLLVWIYVWVYIIRRNLKFINKTTDMFHRAIIIGITMGFISLFVGGIFENNVGDAEVIIFIMYLLGINGNILEGES